MKGPCWKFSENRCKDPCPDGREHRALTKKEKEDKKAASAKRAATRSPSAEREGPCKFFAAGTCMFGDACRQAHAGREKEQVTARAQAKAKAKAQAQAQAQAQVQAQAQAQVQAQAQAQAQALCIPVRRFGLAPSMEK